METAGGSALESVVKTTKMNAFQLMMSSRNKSLGTNCDGKKCLSREGRNEDEQKSTRKDMLKKWADEKGAAKRKRDYAARGEVIDIKLEERSKRLKSMLKIDENQESVVDKNSEKSEPSGSKGSDKKKKKTKPAENKKNENSRKSSQISETKKKSSGSEEEQQNGFTEESNKDYIENNKEGSSNKQKITNEDSDSEIDCDDGEKLGTSFTKKSWKMRIKLKLGDDFQCSTTNMREPFDGTVELDKELQQSVEDGKEATAQDTDKTKKEQNVDAPVEEVMNCSKKELNDQMEAEDKPMVVDSPDESSNQVEDKIESTTDSIDDEVVRTRRSKPIIISSDESSKEDKQIEDKPKENGSTGRVLRPRRSKPAILIESCSSDEEFDSTPSKKEKTRKIEKKEKPTKIAPVFQRSQQPNPQVVEARRAFLLSGMPDCIPQRVETEKLSDPSGYTEFYLEYPEITSVPQTVLTLPKAELNLPPFEPLVPSVPPCKNCLFLQQRPKHKTNSNTQAANVDKDVEIAILKKSNPDLPVERFYKYAKQMHKHGDHTQIWTDKYQAKKVKHLLKNYDSVTKLKDWLKNFNERRMQRGSSGSDFVVSDGEEDFNGGLTGNSVVLSGPTGCGKSNTLYAICTDLGLDVLEINASSKRTGKWLLHELQEATLSHQLNKKSKQNATLADNGWLGNKSTSAAKLKKEEQEKTKDAKKKMCVLFVEDVDVIFDQDDGFIGALKEIVFNSKRPVVMTTTDEDSPNVKKLMWKSIQFGPASVKTLSCWLKVICIVEDLHADLETLSELLKFNKCDLRRTLLDVQTWAGSANSENFKRVENLELLYWNFPTILQSDNADDNEKTKLKKLCDLYDSVILADGILKRSHESLERPFRYPKDSLVLEENFELYGDRQFDEELARSLLESGLKNYGVDSLNLRPISDDWRSKRKAVDFLDEVVQPTAGYAARNLDYMACLCAIAKSEKKRAAASRSKRRFDHFFSTHLDLNKQNWDSICDILNKEK